MRRLCPPGNVRLSAESGPVRRIHYDTLNEVARDAFTRANDSGAIRPKSERTDAAIRVNSYALQGIGAGSMRSR